MRQSQPIVFVALTLGAHLLVASCRAQEATPVGNQYTAGTDRESSTVELLHEIDSQPLLAEAPGKGTPQASTSRANSGWQIAVAPYLWFPGMHGSVTGANGSSISFSSSPGDLLSNFRFGLMGALEASHKRVATSGDMLWVRLQDDKAVPFPGSLATSATMKATEFFLAPKIGVHLVDQEKLRITASAGMRYWHLSENVSFDPTLLGLNFTASQNFLDPLVGGQIRVFLAPKVVVNLVGDVGGWGTGSRLEYQVAGTIGYKLNARWSLHTGYRYLYLDKNADHGVVFDAVISGVVFGVAIDLK